MTEPDGSEICEKILDKYFHRARKESAVELQFFDYEQVKDNLCICVINYERNKEILAGVPYQKYLDLAVVCYVLIQLPNEGLQARMLVYHALLKLWNIKENKLMRTAFYNTFHTVSVRIRKMEDVIVSIDIIEITKVN